MLKYNTIEQKQALRNFNLPFLLALDNSQNLDNLFQYLQEDDEELIQELKQQQSLLQKKIVKPKKFKRNTRKNNSKQQKKNIQLSFNQKNQTESNLEGQHNSSTDFSNVIQSPQIEQSLTCSSDNKSDHIEEEDSFQNLVIDLLQQSESETDQDQQYNNNSQQIYENVHHNEKSQQYFQQQNSNQKQANKQQSNQSYCEQSNIQQLDQQSHTCNSQLKNQQKQMYSNKNTQDNKKQTNQNTSQILNNIDIIHETQSPNKINKKSISTLTEKSNKKINTFTKNSNNESTIDREKERTVKQAILYLAIWKFFQVKENINSQEEPFDYNQMIQILGKKNFDVVKERIEKYKKGELQDVKQRCKPGKQYPDFCAKIVCLPKKTLDDYQTQIQKGWQIGFDFQGAIQQGKKMGELRKFIKENELEEKKISSKQQIKLKTEEICNTLKNKYF